LQYKKIRPEILLTKCCIYNVRFESPNDSIVQEIRRVNQGPDTDYRCHRIGASLRIHCCNNNHKKVNRG
jgi:hypothetical protein